MRDPSFALKINKKFLALLSPTMYHYHNDTARDAQSFEPSFQYYVNQEEPMKKIEFAPFVMIRAIRVPVSSSAFIGFLFLKNLRKSAQISKPFSSWCSFVIRALSWITSFLLGEYSGDIIPILRQYSLYLWKAEGKVHTFTEQTSLSQQSGASLNILLPASRFPPRLLSACVGFKKFLLLQLQSKIAAPFCPIHHSFHPPLSSTPAKLFASPFQTS